MAQASGEKTKRKQKPKKGKVVRLTPDLASLILEERMPDETIPEVIRRLLNPADGISYVLPSDLYPTIEDARGAAVIRKVVRKEEKTERPVPVKKIAKRARG